MKLNNTSLSLLLTAWFASTQVSGAPQPQLSAREIIPRQVQSLSCSDGYYWAKCTPEGSSGMVSSEPYSDGDAWCWIVNGSGDGSAYGPNKYATCSENLTGYTCSKSDGGAGGCGT